MGDMMGWGIGMMVVMSLVSLAVIVAIIMGIVLLVRTLSRRDAQPGIEPRPASILDERLARGEIDREEYESRRRLLGKRSA